MRIDTEIHACTRLLGGPSDGFFGKTIGLTVGQYKVRVMFEESDYLRLLPHPQYDPIEFQNLADLAVVYSEQGYNGGMQLLQATLKHFYETCVARDIALNRPNFTAGYEMNIPRNQGFGESSALVTATLMNLLQWHGVAERFSRAELPSLAYEIETDELHRDGSLQDRVVQLYGGALYMDFAPAETEPLEYGHSTRIEPEKLPPLFIAHLSGTGPSDIVWNDIKARWNEGNPEVRHTVASLAELAGMGMQAIDAADYGKISAVLQEDLRLQRKLYGDPSIGPERLRMAEIARNHDLPATIGGNGIVIGILGDEPQNAAFADHLKSEGYRYLRVAIGPEYPWV